ncbi:hypothetical protein THAOC_36643 [Thalassiosira oceanica]|uniref:Uncharacterized protein n=1 Tax=Thalassiosira oceanica TaxID=159749 RepID=K0R7U8_THAOC|nr:hypothetical protein THAOC_36643 [Thalassiosira oceanica]|eukprot:EJK44791.1 hypothetical protein THAOC_36643 [Thalassiosira oceanica]
MRVSKKFVGDNSLGRKSFRRSTVARSPDESSAAMVELRRLEDAFIAYVKREEEGKKKRSRPNDAPPSKVSSKRKRVENGPRSGREEVAIGSAAATGHMILGSGSKPAAQLSAHSDVQGFNSKGAPPELPPADGFATSRVTSCQVMPHGRDVNDLSSLSSSSVERLLASQGTMAMSHSRDQLHRYQRHPLPLDFPASAPPTVGGPTSAAFATEAPVVKCTVGAFSRGQSWGSIVSFSWSATIHTGIGGSSQSSFIARIVDACRHAALDDFLLHHWHGSAVANVCAVRP